MIAVGDLIFDALGVKVSTFKLLELRKACKAGDSAIAAYMLIDIFKDIIKQAEEPAPAPCCEDDTACGCICEPGNCVAECPCACEACEPAVPAPPAEETENKVIAFDDFLSPFSKFLTAAFSNIVQFFKDLFTGKIAFA